MLVQTFRKFKAGIRKKGIIPYMIDHLLFRSLYPLGRYVELTGNQINIEHLKFRVDSEGLSPRDKGTLWLNRHEQAERGAIRKHLDRALPVIELGGSIGVVACLTNKLLDQPHQHIVVEASPVFTHTLQVNRDLNGCQFHIINQAIGYTGSEGTFNHAGFSSRLGEQSAKSLLIPTTRLETLAEHYQFSTFSLVCDIEGTEFDLMEFEMTYIAAHVSILIIELHPETGAEERLKLLLSQLQTSGFRLIAAEQPGSSVHVFYNMQLRS